MSVSAIEDGFYISDSGPGIPESDCEDVFKAGYSTNKDGTGFGLRTSLRIMPPLGVTLHIENGK